MRKFSTPFKFITIFFVSSLLFIAHHALSYVTGPPTGKTGAPGEDDCTSCHSGSAITNSSAISLITNMTNGQYIPDSVYQIRIRARKTSCVKFGFSTTILDDNASPIKLGLLQVPTASTSIQLTSGTRDYIAHTSSGTSAVFTDSTEWLFNWKAPSSLSGNARLYIAMNATDNSSTNSGDEINLKDFTIPQTTNVPVASITTNVNSICQSDSILFSASGTNGTSSYQWIFSGGTPAVSTAQNVWVKFSSGVKLCSLRVANSIMYSSYITKNVTINANPIAGIIYNSSLLLCTGDSIALSNSFNSVSYSYQWQKDGSNIPGAIGFTYYAKTSGSYTLIVSTTSSCVIITTPITLTFNVKPNAFLTAINGTSTCKGDSIHLKTVSGLNYSYYWYKNNVLEKQSLDSNYYVFLDGDYRVTVFTTTGCNTISNTLTATFYNLPAANISAAFDSICAGDSAKLTVSTLDTITTYQWYLNSTPIIGANKKECYALTSGIYTVELTSNRGCKNTFLAKQIKVNPLPPANFIDSVKIGCIYNLKVRNTGNYNYTWLRNGIPFNTTDTSVTASVTGVYSLLISNATGCQSMTNSISLNIPNAPNANITPLNNAIICSDSNITYQVPNVNGLIYKWYRNGILIIPATQNALTISDSGTYFVVVDNGVCSVNSSSRNVTVNATPVAVVSANDSSYCAGDSIPLTTNNLAGLNYLWYKNNNPLTGTNSSVYYAKSPGAYNVKISSGSCQKISNILNVVEKALPALPVITRNADVLTSTTAVAYQWFKNGLPINAAILQNYTILGNGTYYVEITGSNGCKNKSVAIFVIPVGLDTRANSDIVSAYPNPIQLDLNLNFADFGLHKISVFDAAGKLLKAHYEVEQSTIIDFRDLATGIYFVKVSSAGASQILRVVKQ